MKQLFLKCFVAGTARVTEAMFLRVPWPTQQGTKRAAIHHPGSVAEAATTWSATRGFWNPPLIFPSDFLFLRYRRREQCCRPSASPPLVHSPFGVTTCESGGEGALRNRESGYEESECMKTCTVFAQYVHRTCTVHGPYGAASVLHFICTVSTPDLLRTCTGPSSEPTTKSEQRCE